jgi:sensor c-di-GMP phosphodiesterase-like protein
MSKRLAVSLGVIVTLFAIGVPIGISIYLAWRQAFNDQIVHVGAIADDVLRRSDESVDQTLAIFRTLKQAGAEDPCSPENIRLMSRLDLGSDQVQALAYVQNDQIICTSYNSGRRNTLVGPPAYTTPYGTQIRPDIEFPLLLPGKKFLMTTDAESGYSAVIHSNLPLSVFVGDPDVSVGVFSTLVKRTVMSRGLVKQDWLRRLGRLRRSILPTMTNWWRCAVRASMPWLPMRPFPRKSWPRGCGAMP